VVGNIVAATGRYNVAMGPTGAGGRHVDWVIAYSGTSGRCAGRRRPALEVEGWI
jgi:hypothetical protein